MAISEDGRASRRAVLVASMGALAGAIAHALGKPERVLAGTDGDVVLGAANAATSPTSISTTAQGGVLQLTSQNVASAALLATGSGAGGLPAVIATADGPGKNVPDRTGIYGYGARGVVGQSNGQSGYNGVHGYTGPGDPPLSKPDANGFPTGVYGEADGADATGLWGYASNETNDSVGSYGEGSTGVWGYGGWGVFGASGNIGVGVYGFTSDLGSVNNAPVNSGVVGYSRTGNGVYASSPSGVALNVNGKARFTRSGRLAIAAGRSYVIKYLAGVTTASLIVAVLQTHRPGIAVAAAVPVTGRFTIYLTKAVSATTYVAYFVIN
jgi:hypothetical protein